MTDLFLEPKVLNYQADRYELILLTLRWARALKAKGTPTPMADLIEQALHDIVEGKVTREEIIAAKAALPTPPPSDLPSAVSVADIGAGEAKVALAADDDEEGEKKGIEIEFEVAKGERRDHHLQKALGNTGSTGTGLEKELFADIGFEFEEGVNQDEALAFVQTQKEMIFAIAGGAVPGFSELFEQFGSVEFHKGSTNKNTVVLRIKGQPSAQQTAEGLLGHGHQLLLALPTNQFFKFHIKSKYTFDDIFNNNYTLLQALHGYEVSIQAQIIRDYLRKIGKATGDSKLATLVHLFTATTDLNLSVKLEVENAVPEDMVEKLSIPCSIAKDMISPMVNQFLGEDSLAHKLKGICITINAFELLAHLKLNIPGLLK